MRGHLLAAVAIVALGLLRWSDPTPAAVDGTVVALLLICASLIAWPAAHPPTARSARR